MLGDSLLLESCDNLVSSQVAPLGVVLGLAQLDHTNQMTLDVAAGNEFHKVSTGKPAVNEQIVETDAASDGILHHLNGLVGLLHRVFPDAFLDALSCVVGRETLAALLVCQPLLFLRLTSLLSMKRKVEEQPAHSVAQEQRQALVAENALMLDMGEFFIIPKFYTAILLILLLNFKYSLPETSVLESNSLKLLLVIFASLNEIMRPTFSSSSETSKVLLFLTASFLRRQ